MTTDEIKDVLGNLDELSILNLQAGRVTRDAMHLAMQRAKKHSEDYWDISLLGGEGNLSTILEMRIADEVNELLKAAREILEDSGFCSG